VASGERIFHERSLFAEGQAPVGNGSCSSCHGIHAAKYANDASVGNLGAVQPLFVSGQIIPQPVVGTDDARLGGAYAATGAAVYRAEYSTTWWSFVDNSAADPLSEGLNDYAGPLRKQGACGWEQERIGYAAPPLLGVWASAPYFHNGSVPTVWGVLKPDSRPEYWRRQLSSDPLAGPERGFATDFTAYDEIELGWKYDVVAPTAADPTGLGLDRPLYQLGVGFLGAPWSPAESSQAEERKIYNTHLFGKSNRGHAWTAVLEDWERRDLIEFLKTL
jgi:hypothetical protein